MEADQTPESQAYLTIQSDFTDFVFFQGDSEKRANEREKFINDEIYVPRYTYPKLDTLPYNSQVVALKTSLLEASYGLADYKKTPEVTLQVDYIHNELSRIALTEEAAYMQTYHSSAEYETSARAFKQKNLEAYGEYDNELGRQMLATEYSHTEAFEPSSIVTARIKQELLHLLNTSKGEQSKEKPLLDDNEMEQLHTSAIKRFRDTLNLVPNSDNFITYNAQACVDILNTAISYDKLDLLGWKAVVSQDSMVPVTYLKQKSIDIPVSVAYTADDIRRVLIGHELKAHVWRYENARTAQNRILEEGTAASPDIEEGLGILIECAIAGNLDNPSLHRARDRYITVGLATGADGNERDAREVYEIIWRILALRNMKDATNEGETISQSKHMAYTHIENAFRGTSFTRKGVIYSKLKIYYEGLQKNAVYFKNRMDDLDAAFDAALIGRFDHTNDAERDYFLSTHNHSS